MPGERDRRDAGDRIGRRGRRAALSALFAAVILLKAAGTRRRLSADEAGDRGLDGRWIVNQLVKRLQESGALPVRDDLDRQPLNPGAVLAVAAYPGRRERVDEQGYAPPVQAAADLGPDLRAQAGGGDNALQNFTQRTSPMGCSLCPRAGCQIVTTAALGSIN